MQEQEMAETARAQSVPWYNQVPGANDARLEEVMKMSIRPLRQTDLDAVMRLWLAANTEAHAFIPRSYWESHVQQVRQALLHAHVRVYEQGGQICGMIGLQQDYIAGLFVQREWRSHGIGHALLQAVKAGHQTLTLSVYRQNQGAVRFYRREGFDIVCMQPDSDTGADAYHMAWRRPVLPSD